MRPYIYFLFLLISSSSLAYELTGHDIAQRQADLNAGFHDEVALGKMTIKGKSGSEVVREFSYATLEKTATTGDKSLIRILNPADLKGVGLLGFTNKDRDDDQWLYMPAMKKTKRIAGASKKGYFIGSDFTYEDLSLKVVNDYDYQLLRTEACDTATCFVVESKPKFADSAYTKSILWIRNDNFQNVRVDLFNKAGELIKRSTFSELRTLNGKFWRAFVVTMQDLIKGRATELGFTDIKLDRGLSDNDFTQTVLERE